MSGCCVNSSFANRYLQVVLKFTFPNCLHAYYVVRYTHRTQVWRRMGNGNVMQWGICMSVLVNYVDKHKQAHTYRRKYKWCAINGTSVFVIFLLRWIVCGINAFLLLVFYPFVYHTAINIVFFVIPFLILSIHIHTYTHGHKCISIHSFTHTQSWTNVYS